MNPSFSGERFATSPEVRKTLDEARTALQPFTDDLRTESALFNGTVLYQLDERRKGDADAVVAVDAPDIDPKRLDFRRQYIEGARVELAHTALGYSLGLRHPEFVESRMHPGKHITWANRTVGGGVQLAFDIEAEGILPSNDHVDDIWEKHQDDIHEAARAVNELSKTTESLGDSLELLPPATPNAFIIRWDMANSTPVATGRQYGALRSYQQKWDRLLETLVRPHSAGFTNEGDGQNIILPFDKGLDPNNLLELRVRANTLIRPLIDDILSAHHSLAYEYPDLKPALHLGVGIGHLEDSPQGLTGPELWELGALVKNSPATGPLYTPAAMHIFRPEREIN